MFATFNPACKTESYSNSTHIYIYFKLYTLQTRITLSTAHTAATIADPAIFVLLTNARCNMMVMRGPVQSYNMIWCHGVLYNPAEYNIEQTTSPVPHPHHNYNAMGSTLSPKSNSFFLCPCVILPPNLGKNGNLVFA